MAELSDYDRWIVTVLFHAAWYAATYRDVAEADAFAHFCDAGAAAGRNPNWLFDTKWYLARYPKAAAGPLNALEHYVGVGARAGHDPGPLFCTRWYLLRNPDVAKIGLNPLDHYIQWGPSQRRDPSPLFDSHWYFAQYPETKTDGVDACMHFMAEGARLGFSPSPLFDTAWYLATYPDVARSGENPLLHYLAKGAAQGRDPGPDFSTTAYCAANPDVAASGVNPLVHHLTTARAPAGPPPTALINRVSPAAIQAAAALLGKVDVDLPELSTIALTTPPGWAAAWRGLYLSLTCAPREVILVGQIDATPTLAQLAATPGLLVLETDGAATSIADGLPAGTDWRALSEFDPHATPEPRAALVATLVAALLPERVLIRGSAAGHRMRDAAAA